MEEHKKIREDARRSAEVLRGCSVGMSSFLDDWGASLVISELKSVGGISWVDSGGLPGATGRVVAYTCGKYLGVDAIPFIYLFIKPISGLTRPSVPEALDAIDKAGLPKDTDVGDLYGHENGFFVIAIDRKRKFPPSVSEIETDGYVISRVDKSLFENMAAKASEKDTTVASPRLDAVVAITANISRSKAKKMIEAGLVMVDYIPVAKAEKSVEPGSIISTKGKRRIRLVAIDGPTKKGRFRVTSEIIP